MPEGPEVEHLTIDVLSKYIGKKLNNIKINSGRYKNHGPPSNYYTFIHQFPIKCINIYKKGKVIFFVFENNWHIISKLGMTGWWFNYDNEPEWRNSNTKNIIFTFNNTKKELIFSDFRNFGTLTFTNNLDLVNEEIIKLAPDITNSKTYFSTIKNRIEKLTNSVNNSKIEDIIINQKIIFSGIGNYLKSEILYQSKISPLRKIKDITLDEWKTIFKISKQITNKMRKILNSNNLEDYFNEMKIYKKKLDPYGNKIKTRSSKFGRTTFYVSSIQK
jgi:formamidopyrimidine-DNA glycosylase